MADFALGVGQWTPTVVRCMRKAEVGVGWQVYCQLCPAGVRLSSCRQRQRLAGHRGWSSSTPAAAEDCRLWTAADLHPTSRTGHTGQQSASHRGRSILLHGAGARLHNLLRIMSPQPRPQFNMTSIELETVPVNTPSPVAFHPPWFRTEH